MKKSHLWQKFGLTGIILSLVVLILSACGSGSASSSGGKKDLGKATLVTNWFAEAEHGGNYAALKKGFYKDEGIDMKVQPGGPKVSATQIVASGKAQFGYTEGEDLLIARDKGIPLVAIAAIFQDTPYVLISHKEAGVKDFSDLSGKTVFTAPGVGYWQYVKQSYKLKNVKDRTYTGTLNEFVNNPKAVTQGYITSEPFALKQKGVDISYLEVKNSGFDPYSNVIFTTERTIKQHPELVKAFMKATVKGWSYYKTHSDEINPFLKKYNPDLTTAQMKYGAKTEQPFVFGGDAKTHGFGYMSADRWSKLQKQLIDLGLIKDKEDPSKYFTTKFLPKGE